MKGILRYSEAFKQKVVKEIEEGQINIYRARSVYDIKGGNTVQQ